VVFFCFKLLNPIPNDTTAATAEAAAPKYY
jgi:hypothetical protein